MTRDRFSSHSGFTVMELITVSVIIGLLATFTQPIFRSFTRGQRNVQVKLPVQRSALQALQAVRKDILSGSRSSMGNMIDGSFEKFPYPLSSTPIPGRWTNPPVRMTPIPNPLLPRQYARAQITSRDDCVHGGKAALLLMSFGMDYSVIGPTVTLVSGETYVIGAWERWISDNANLSVELWNATPSRVAFITGISPTWSPLRITGLTGYAGVFHIRLRISGPGVFAVDDVVFKRLTTDLTPSNGQTFEFDRFSNDSGDRIHSRFRIEPAGISGNLIRESIDPAGNWVEYAGPISNIRRLNISHLGGVAGFVADWAGQPMQILVEAGPLTPASPDSVVALTTNVLPGTY